METMLPPRCKVPKSERDNALLKRTLNESASWWINVLQSISRTSIRRKRKERKKRNLRKRKISLNQSQRGKSHERIVLRLQPSCLQTVGRKGWEGEWLDQIIINLNAEDGGLKVIGVVILANNHALEDHNIVVNKTGNPDRGIEAITKSSQAQVVNISSEIKGQDRDSLNVRIMATDNQI